jgi:hypothetical protein
LLMIPMIMSGAPLALPFSSLVKEKSNVRPGFSVC